MKKFNRFDNTKAPMHFRWYLRPIAKLMFGPNIKKYKPIIHYHNGVEKLSKSEEPYILLGNHNAFLDFSIAYHLLGKKSPNFVVALDGFIGREWLLRRIGCICKRKFTNDILLIHKIKKCLERGDIPVLYPEARYSLCGTTAVLPESLGKMLKLFKVPVALIVCHGHHINSPFWDTSHQRGIDHDEVDYTLLFTKEELETLSVDEINEKLVDAYQYDDFKWQKDNKISVKDPNRADGLDKVLYQCPHCGKEFEMISKGAILKCNACNKEWKMTEFGELKALKGKTEFSHIPDWYEWQRENVRKEVAEGNYSTGDMPVRIKSLPNAKKFIDVGEGVLTHDMNGFRVKLNDASLSDTNEIVIPPSLMYSCHIEYRYLFKNGDCIDLNTKDDTWYIYPHSCKFAVTKIALATEELFDEFKRRKGIIIKKGLA